MRTPQLEHAGPRQLERVAEADLDVGRDLPVAAAHHREAARKERLGRKGVPVARAAVVGAHVGPERERAVLARGLIVDPDVLRNDHLRVVQERVVAAVVEEEHHRDLAGILADDAAVALLRLDAGVAVGQEHEPVEEGPGAVRAEPDPALAADAEPAEGRALLEGLPLERLGRRRLAAVHLGGEDAEHLAAPRRPVGGGHGAAVGKAQQFGDFVGRDGRLVVVDGRRRVGRREGGDRFHDSDGSDGLTRRG